MLDLASIEAAVDKEKSFEAVEKLYPDMVAGRVAHIDADFLAYMASYERKDEVSTFEDILYRTNVMVTDKRLECGAEFAVLHLTPNTSDKGGRYEVAIQQKYQGQRVSDDKPRYLEAIRTVMGGFTGDVTGRAWEHAEADDGMAAAAWKAMGDGTSELCVIATKDKDLRMCPGLHLNWDTGTIVDNTGDLFGWIGIKEKAGAADPKTGKVKINKKPIGYGTHWFWFQMLMGDTADHIKGCPKVLNAKGDKLVNCGMVGAYTLLRDAKSDEECLRIIMDCYKLSTYTHWETGEDATWQDVMWSNAQMLWMQRTPGDINDVKKFIKDMLNGK